MGSSSRQYKHLSGPLRVGREVIKQGDGESDGSRGGGRNGHRDVVVCMINSAGIGMRRGEMRWKRYDRSIAVLVLLVGLGLWRPGRDDGYVPCTSTFICIITIVVE